MSPPSKTTATVTLMRRLSPQLGEEQRRAWGRELLAKLTEIGVRPGEEFLLVHGRELEENTLGGRLHRRGF